MSEQLLLEQRSMELVMLWDRGGGQKVLGRAGRAIPCEVWKPACRDHGSELSFRSQKAGNLGDWGNLLFSSRLAGLSTLGTYIIPGWQARVCEV